MKPQTNYFLILVMTLLAENSLASCINSPVEETAVNRGEASASNPVDETAITTGEEFNLALGEKILVPSEDLTLQFLGVPVDDRCPTQVECEYTGQAIVEIKVGKVNTDSVLLEFNTNPHPDINRQSLTELGYLFELVRLDPYPEHSDYPIQSEDYRAVMVVRKR